MKTLFVLRHGHAAAESEGGSDHERALTPRGVGEVQRSVARLAAHGNPPSLLLSSTAVRARQSAELWAQGLGTQPTLRLIEDLYLAPPPAYLTALATHGGEHASVMVVGHNPGLEALIYVLTDRSEHLATASLVEIEVLVGSWVRLAQQPRGLGRIVHAFRA